MIVTKKQVLQQKPPKTNKKKWSQQNSTDAKYHYEKHKIVYKTKMNTQSNSFLNYLPIKQKNLTLKQLK